MATLYIRKRNSRTGREYYRVYIRFIDSYGVTHRKSTPFTLESIKKRNGSVHFPPHITEFKEKLEAKITLDSWGLSPKRITKIRLSAVFAEFLERRASERAKRTKYLYELAVNKFKTLHGDLYIHEITTDKMHGFKTYWIKKDGKVNTSVYIRSLSPILRYATDQNYIVKNPINADIRITVDYEEPEIYTIEQIKEIFAYCELGYTDSAGKTVRTDLALRDQLRFLLLTGFRSDESCQLLWEHIDTANKRIFHINTKSKRDEYFPMDNVLEEHFKNLSKDYYPYVFKYRNYSTIGKKLRRINRALKYSDKLNVHALKATYATWIQEAGIKPASSEFLTHHRDWKKVTLKHYAKLKLDMHREELSKSRKEI